MRFAVTPYAGVWIEMRTTALMINRYIVTPYAGVWIEIIKMMDLTDPETGHSLRGSVD